MRWSVPVGDWHFYTPMLWTTFWNACLTAQKWNHHWRRCHPSKLGACRETFPDLRASQAGMRGGEVMARTKERALAIAPILEELVDEVAVLRIKYQRGETIDHAIGEVRNALECLEDTLEKNREAVK